MKILWPDGWVHVRASNTQSLVRIIAEADEAERAQELLDWPARGSRHESHPHAEDQRLRSPRGRGRLAHPGDGHAVRPGPRHLRRRGPGGHRARPPHLGRDGAPGGGGRARLERLPRERPRRLPHPHRAAAGARAGGVGGIAITASHNPPEWNAPQVRGERRPLPERGPGPRASRHLPPGRLREGPRSRPATAGADPGRRRPPRAGGRLRDRPAPGGRPAAEGGGGPRGRGRPRWQRPVSSRPSAPSRGHLHHRRRPLPPASGAHRREPRGAGGRGPAPTAPTWASPRTWTATDWPSSTPPGGRSARN